VKDKRREEAEYVVFPSKDQYVSTCLIPSDFTSTVQAAVLPYGPQNMNFVRQKLRFALTNLTQSAITDTLFPYAFSASQAPAFVDLAAAFDQYKIEAISMEFAPTINVSPNIAPVTSAVMPRLYTVIDYDDATFPNTIDILRQYETCQVAPPCAGVVRTFVPRIANAVYGGSAFTSFGNSGPQWIDAASPGVQHYGIKAGVSGGATGQTILQQYTVDVVLYCAFRNGR